ncbi:MAG: hypothetical protein M5U26_12515 [Planctomycetota bacterium]|nr:hypothetical protein [Planctomycetota bacterium]
MSTKQTVIFVFMLIFMVATLVTLGMWFHYALDVNIKKKEIKKLEDQIVQAKRKRDAVRKVVENPEEPDKDLTNRLNALTQQADQKYAEVWTDQMAIYPAYLNKLPEIEREWAAAGQEWGKVYDDWTKRNKQIREALEAYEKLQVDSIKRVDESRTQLTAELEKEETQRRSLVADYKKWDDQLGETRLAGEDLLDKINSVTRELERTSEQEVDGKIIYAAPDLNSVTVDLGAQHGAQKGMKFQVYSARYSVPVLKAEIQLVEINATSSRAIVLPRIGRPLWDSQTGYEAVDDKMRYSPLSASGPDESEPQALEKKKSKKDVVEEIRLEQVRRELGPEAVQKIIEEREAPTVPPLALGKGFDPLMAGDWLSNTEFVRIVPEREWRKQSTDELLGLKDINLGSLTIFLSDTIRPYRREFLKRLCERNRCKSSDVMTSDVDIIVSTTTTVRADLLERELEPMKDKAEVSAEIAAKRTTLAALKDGQKFGSKVLTEEELEAFFIKRQRKSELSKGNVIQPGQYVFFVVGETRLRSVRETGLYIQENGGVLAQRLGSGVDYVVVGAGLSNANLDKDTGRLYYEGQEVPAGVTPVPFYDAVKEMGLKILREEELAHFFGLD